ncbi:MAG: DNA glycosylase [Planctomycetota bacterium]
MPSIEVKDFNLTHTLECGQLFRAVKRKGWYYVGCRDRVFKVRQNDNTLEYDGADEEFLVHFLALDIDLEAIYRKINVDPHIDEAIRQCRGLRICRQDPWECLVSFICSSANTIQNIRKVVERLSERFGQKIRLDDYETYSFPNPGTLNDVESLREAKAGFRAESIAVANNLVTDEYLRALPSAGYEAARDRLMQISGVADKTADCVLLFSMDFLCAFPIDTWVKQVMAKKYFQGQNVSLQKMREFAMIYFGEYAGYAQEYLFHKVRLDAGRVKPAKTSG